MRWMVVFACISYGVWVWSWIVAGWVGAGRALCVYVWCIIQCLIEVGSFVVSVQLECGLSAAARCVVTDHLRSYINIISGYCDNYWDIISPGVRRRQSVLSFHSNAYAVAACVVVFAWIRSMGLRAGVSTGHVHTVDMNMAYGSWSVGTAGVWDRCVAGRQLSDMCIVEWTPGVVLITAAWCLDMWRVVWRPCVGGVFAGE